MNTFLKHVPSRIWTPTTSSRGWRRTWAPHRSHGLPRREEHRAQLGHKRSIDGRASGQVPHSGAGTAGPLSQGQSQYDPPLRPPCLHAPRTPSPIARAPPKAPQRVVERPHVRAVEAGQRRRHRLRPDQARGEGCGSFRVRGVVCGPGCFDEPGESKVVAGPRQCAHATDKCEQHELCARPALAVRLINATHLYKKSDTVSPLSWINGASPLPYCALLDGGHVVQYLTQPDAPHELAHVHACHAIATARSVRQSMVRRTLGSPETLGRNRWAAGERGTRSQACPATPRARRYC